MLDILKKEDVRHLIHLGDVYDRRKYVNYATASRFRTECLEPLNAATIESHLITGNHDEYYKNTHIVNALDENISNRYDSIHVYNTPVLIDIAGTKIQLMPWITESNQEESHYVIDKPKADILMGHLEIENFKMYKDSLSEHGLDPNKFSLFDIVYSGHYHHKSARGNIVYLGAFGEYTWSDHNDFRGFHIFDLSTRQLTPYQNINHMFKMMIYDDVKEKDIIAKIQATNFSKYKDCYVKIVCVNKTNMYAWDMLIDNLYKVNPIDISIVEDANSFSDTKEDEIINETQDTATILDSYIDGLTLPVNNDRMKKFMRSVYNDAVTMENVT